MEIDAAGVTTHRRRWRREFYSEFRTQCPIALPLIAMNFAWFAKTAITTAFLGRLGELPLAGATLGFTFGNVTGFSVLNGLAAGMEPICGQAFGAKNFRVLRRSLLMGVALLLGVSVPIGFLWMNVDRILILVGQQKEIADVAKDYLVYLIPDLAMTSILCPLRTYLSAQNVISPIMFSSAAAAAIHIPVNILLSRAMGLRGISMAVWITDSVIVLFLGLYILISEKWPEKWWPEFEIGEWLRLLKLCGTCCVTTCLEWWCYEILVLLSGHLPDPKRSVGALAIVLNFDYLLYSFMLSLSTCASIRVANELGSARPESASLSVRFSLTLSAASGVIGAAAMAGARGCWGKLYTREGGIVETVKRTMGVMCFVELVNFPVAVCGGIVRGTAAPWMAMYANVLGFYLLALPVGGVLGFRLGLGLRGLLVGFLAGGFACLLVLLAFISRIDWDAEARKAHASAHAEENARMGANLPEIA